MQKPDPLSLFSDYAKTAITLASAILAITAGFATALLGHTLTGIAIAALTAFWGALVASIILSIQLATGVISAVRPPLPDANGAVHQPTPDENKRSWNRLAFYANGAFYTLAFGLFSLGVLFAIAQAVTKKEPVPLADALRALDSVGSRLCSIKPGSMRLQSATYDGGTKQWLLTLSRPCYPQAVPRTTYLLVSVRDDTVTSIEAR